MDKKDLKIPMSTTTEEQSLCKDIIGLLDDNKAYWYHKEDKCMYFVVDDLLYGWTIINQKILTGGILYVFWRDDADFNIVDKSRNNTTLNKKRTVDYRFLENDELKYLHYRMEETL